MKTVFLLAVAAVGSIAAAPLWQTPGLIGELKLDRERTASRWIWSNGRPRDNEVALFRFAFEADSPVSSGRLSFASDDIGHLYLNGTEIHPSKFAAAVKPGRNVMAVCVTNVYSMGGMIAFGDFTFKSGRTLGLRSCAAFKAWDAGKGAPEGWERTDFDDAAWAPAVELGDARMRPFSKYRDYTKDFATAAEREAIAAAAEAAKSDWPLPAGLADEPEPSVRVVYEGNRPLVEVNGLRMEPDFSLSGGSNPFKLSSIAKMRDLGIRFYRVDVSGEEIEKAAGVWDFSKFDERAREILHFAPDGYLTLSVRLEMPKWLAGHPEAWIGYANGETESGTGDERIARLRRPSSSSPEYRAEAYRFLRAFGDYVRSRPWGRRVVAVRPCWGIYTEWHTYGFYEGPDVGPAMTAAFRRWKGGRYANENPPTMAERTHGATLLDPSADRKVLDYYDCMANEVSDFLIGCCRAVKEAFPGRLAGAYYGYLFAVHPPEGATAMLEKVLSAPEVDFLSDPAMYSPESRRAGGSYYHRTVTETFHRYGKLSIIEDDMRFHHIRDWTEKAITTETPRESRMTMRRNYLNKLFDGSGIQFCDPCAGREVRPFTHDDPDVLLGMSEAMDAVRKAGTQPKASGNDTVLVISALERFRRDGRPSGSKLIGRTYCALEWIYRSGIAFDIMTLDDFLREDRGYRRVIMLNAYGPSSAERTALKARLRRPGVTTLWLTASGCAVPEGFSDAAMTDLTGLPLCGAGREPKVSCTDGSAERIPQNGVKKTLPDGSVAAFLPEPPSDRWQWRSVLMALGAKPIAEVGNYVRRHGDLVLFHNAEAGEHEIVPPDDLIGRPCEDLLTGERHPAGPLHLRLDGVDTRLFRFLPASVRRPDDPSTRIVYEGSRGFIEVNGERLEPNLNFDWSDCPQGHAFDRKIADLGFRIVSCGIWGAKAEKAPGVYDFSDLDRRATNLVERIPNCLIDIGFWLDLPKWCAANPDEIIGYADGKAGEGDTDERLGRPIRPSAASAAFRREAAHFIAELGRFVRSRPWGKRVVMVRPKWGVYCEWHYWGMYHFPDTGKAMTEAFRRWNGGKWADAALPTVEERIAGGGWFDPVKDAKTLDYYRCMAETVSDFLLFCCHESRQAFPGRLIGAYYGYVMAPHPPEGATVMLEKVLSSPDVDFLSNPSMYTVGSRRAGGAYYNRTIPASFRRHGKLAFIEDDMRFHHIRDFITSKSGRAICTTTPRESRMTMRRNYLNRLFDGAGMQINDPMSDTFGKRPHAYDDPDVLAGMREAMEVVGKIGVQPVDSGNEVALVVDPLDRLRRSVKPRAGFTVPRYFSALEFVYRTGVAFDMLTEDDLAAGRTYRHVVRIGDFEGREIPYSVEGWRAEFDRRGIRALAPMDNYVRRHGNLILFHTAQSGEQVLLPPDDLAGCPAVELFSGRACGPGGIRIVTDGPDTLLFRFAK